MPVVNPLARELVFKIVYYGPGLGGKTTTLQFIHAHTKAEHRGKMVSLATPVDRTLYFDFLPIRVPNVRGMAVRLQLFTVPGQVYYNATRKLVLTGADGVVLVADSQRARFDANLESLDNLRENLREHGRTLAQMPHVLQYNKRDLAEVVSIEELDARLNSHGASAFATVATRGEGVFEALEAIARAVLDDYERRMPEQRGTAVQELELPEEGLADALRRADVGSAPPAAAGASAARAGASPPVDRHLELARAAGAEPDAQPVESSGVAPASPGSTPASGAPAAGAGTAQGAAERERRAAGPGFSALWPAAEQRTVHELEDALGRAEFESVVALSDQLLSRTLASAASLLGSTADAPRDPATVAMLLGLEGPRYLRFRTLVRDARSGRAISGTEALAAYAFAIQARVMRNEL